DRVALRWNEAEADEWSTLVERRWILWAENPIECDAAGKHTIDQLTAQVLKTWYAYGEAVSLLPAIRRDISITKTKVQLILPHRLVQDTEEISGFYQGIRMDDFGFPLAYRFLQDRVTQDRIDIAARDSA